MNEFNDDVWFAAGKRIGELEYIQFTTTTYEQLVSQLPESTLPYAKRISDIFPNREVVGPSTFEQVMDWITNENVKSINNLNLIKQNINTEPTEPTEQTESTEPTEPTEPTENFINIYCINKWKNNKYNETTNYIKL